MRYNNEKYHYKIIYIIIIFFSLAIFAQKPINQKFIASDSSCAIFAPSNWSEMFFLEGAALQLGNINVDEYCYILSFPEVDKLEWNLQRLSYKFLGDALESIINPTIMDPKKYKISGLSALQIEIKGIENGVEVHWISTFVEGKKSFYQIMVWTSGAKYEANKKILKKVIESFVELK